MGTARDAILKQDIGAIGCILSLEFRRAQRKYGYLMSHPGGHSGETSVE